MTIDEAIKYYIHIENNLRERIKEEQDKKEESVFCEKEIAEFLNTADKYKQLAEWLKELKERREVDNQPVKWEQWLNKEELLNYLEPLTNTPGIVIKRHIKEMKGVKIKPAYYAEWEIFWQNGRPKLKCTNCHTLFDIRTNDKHLCIYPKFCEECGADMRNKED